MKILLVGIGGALGSILRYLATNGVQQLFRGAFPFGTMAVNILGCLVIGFLSQLSDMRSVFTPESRAFVFVGVLGGFTTFSSFGNESVNLLRAGTTGQALANVTVQIAVGLAAVGTGRLLAHQVLG